MPPCLFAEPSVLVAVLRNLSTRDLLSMAATSSRVQDALAPVLLEMSSGSTKLPLWLPMSGSVHRRIFGVKQRVGIKDTESSLQESSATLDRVAWFAMVSMSMVPVPEVEWRGSGVPTFDHGTPYLIRDWVKSRRWSAATGWAPCELYLRHGDAMLCCGEDGAGHDVRLRVADMLRYCTCVDTDSNPPW